MDYFPHKLEQQHATGFTVEYHNSYKTVTGPDIGTIVLYQCGTPPPDAAALGVDDISAVTTLSIPLTKVALLSTSQIPFIEFIGERPAIGALHGTTNTGALTVSSPCLREMIADGTTVNFATDETSWAVDYSTMPADIDGVFCTAGFGCSGLPESSTALPVAENKEPSVLGTVEWVEYFALFFNRELEARQHVEQVAGRYASTRSLVAAAASSSSTKPKVVWAYNYWGWYAGTCPGTYYCQVIEDAGGEWLQMPAPAEGSYSLSDDEFFAAAAAADVWLYPSNNWDEMQASLGEANVAQVAAVGKGRVYDITGNNAYGKDAGDWLESRFAEPDVFLEDLTTALTPTAHTDHAAVWWRNVATETAKAPRACADRAAPLVLWQDTESVVTVGVPVGRGDAAAGGTPLKDGSAKPASEASGAHPALLSQTLLVLAAVVVAAV